MILDKLDTDILKLLEADSRKSQSYIASQLHVSKTMVSYRFNRLRKRGVITGFQLIADRAALGMSSYGLLVKFQGVTMQEEEQLLKKITTSKVFDWVVSTSGRWDLMAVVITKNTALFIDVLDQFFLTYGAHIKEYNFYIDYEGTIHDHNYLYAVPYNSSVTYARRKVNAAVTELEKDIIKHLNRDPTLSLLKLANRLGKTYDTIQSKYRALSTKGILLKAVPVINYELLGHKNVVCLYNLSPDQDRLNQLLMFCSTHPNIVRQARSLGHINLLLNIHYRDERHLKEVMGEISKQFSDIILTVDLVHVN
jgi:Lrp/AsnC family transcriptional regulator